MICPCCRVSVGRFNDWKIIEIIEHERYEYKIKYFVCVECNKISMVFSVEPNVMRFIGKSESMPEKIEKMLIPETAGRNPIPNNVEKIYADDYHKAVKLLSIDASASAIYSRRVLQHYIEKKKGIKKQNLQEEIKELDKNKKYPSDIIRLFSYIRHYGKFAAHACTDYDTCELIDVDIDEAEALLSIIEEMFDYDYARAKKFEELNKKLQQKQRQSNPTQNKN